MVRRCTCLCRFLIVACCGMCASLAFQDGWVPVAQRLADTEGEGKTDEDMHNICRRMYWCPLPITYLQLGMQT